jgi:26S proteasome regulatory subunit N3
MKHTQKAVRPSGSSFNLGLTVVAKTGQALIANPIFDSLPSTTSKDESAMQVDSSAPTTEVGETDKEKEKEATKASSGKKYTAPLDGQSGDLIIEGTAYLRLLLVLMNLDAGKVEEVSFPGLDPSSKLTRQAAKFSDETAEVLATANRRSMDQISAKVHFYLALAYERLGRLEA